MTESTSNEMKPMDCNDIKAVLSGLIDDEVDVATRHRAERHLVECAPCRKLVDKAETTEVILAAQIDLAGPGDELPSGFVGGVLSQTVFADRRASIFQRTTAWSGWVAAAAALGLAATIYLMDRPSGLDRLPAYVEASSRGGVDVQRTGGLHRSWVLPATEVASHRTTVVDDDDADVEGFRDALVMTGKRGFAAPAVAEATPGPAVVPLTRKAMLSREDAEVMSAASLALQILLDADERSFGDVERVRRIAEYDQLVERLIAARETLDATDRATVMATVSVLTRVVRGPVNQADLAEIKWDVRSLELPRQLDEMGRRWGSGVVM